MANHFNGWGSPNSFLQCYAIVPEIVTSWKQHRKATTDAKNETDTGKKASMAGYETEYLAFIKANWPDRFS
eukprot:3255596-Alexandrium_andersonii.AAC.1